MRKKMSSLDLMTRLTVAVRDRLECEAPDLLDEIVEIRALNVEQAIGDPAPFTDFALQRGEERLVEAVVRGAKGQAFTSHLSSWSGTVSEMLSLPLSEDRERAIATAGINAIGLHLNWGDKTIHCRDASPKTCGEKMGGRLAEELVNGEKVAIIGYQPAILKGLSESLGPERVLVLDLNPENIGRTVHGVTVLDGEKDLTRAASLADVALATGSSMSNGTIDGILEAFAGKRTIFFGTTIAIPAELLGLERFCFEAE